MRTPLDIACRHCAQQPGEPCIDVDQLVTWPPAVMPLHYIHAERIIDFDSMPRPILDVATTS